MLIKMQTSCIFAVITKLMDRAILMSAASKTNSINQNKQILIRDANSMTD